MVRPYPPFETERLLLRPFSDADLDALIDMQGRPEVTRYLYWEPRDRAEVVEQLERLKGMVGIDEAHDELRLAGVLRETGALVGDFSLWRTSREHRQGEFGFIVHPDHQGRGYATEGGAAMLRIGFEEAVLHRIAGRCDGRNTASARVMDRLGMRREAHFRENELVKGEWTDEVVYALLRSEWQGR